MKIFVLTLAVFATGVSALSNKYLPPRHSSGSSFASFASASIPQPSRQYLSPAVSSSYGKTTGISSGGPTFSDFGAFFSGNGVAAQPSRQYLAPATSSSYGVSNGLLLGGSSVGSHSVGSSFGGFGSASSGHGAATQPSRKYLAPATFSSHGASTGLLLGGSVSGSHSVHSSFGSFGSASSGHGAATQPSRQYLAPATFSSHGVSTGLLSGGSSLGSHSVGSLFGSFGSASSGHGVATQPSHQYLAPAAFNSHSVSSHHSDTKYGSNGGYEYRHR